VEVRLSERSRRFVLRGAIVLGLVVVPTAVAAHPLIDEANAKIERAQFDEALVVLKRAETTGSLSRAEVLRLFELKALVHLALGARAEAEQSLRLIATLAPDYRFSRHTSPDLVLAFDVARRHAPAPPRLVVEQEPRRHAVALRARLDNDPLSLVRRVQLRVRLNGGPWRVLAGASAVIDVSPGDRLDFNAQAHGKSGILLETPIRQYATRPASKEPPAGGVSPWWYAGGAAILAVGAIVAGGFLLSNGGSDRTQPTPPSLEGR
jgi:hypothetical protein